MAAPSRRLPFAAPAWPSGRQSIAIAPWARLLVLILAAGAGLRLTLAFLTPPLYAPDEAGHLLYVHEIAMHWSFPVQSLDGRWSNFNGANEFYQPPLYYLLAALPYRLLHAFGLWPIFAIRVLNVGLGLTMVLVVYQIGKQVFPERPAIALTAAALTALIPTVAADSATVNNDPLIILLVGLASLSLLRSLTSSEVTRRTVLEVALLTAAALYTKTSAIVIVPAIVAWAVLRQRHRLPAWRPALAMIVLPIAAVLPWWLGRNLPAYHDLLGVQIGWEQFATPPLTVVRQTAIYLGWTFWTAFGRTYDIQPLVLGMLLCLVGMVAVIRLAARVVLDCASGRRGRPGSGTPALTALQLEAALVLGAEFAVALAGSIGYSVQFGFTEGRYLYPVLPAITLAIAAGLAGLRGRPSSLQVPVAVAWTMGVLAFALLAVTVLPAYHQVVADASLGGPMLPRHTGDYQTWVSQRTAPIR
jgi:4-amino-4-deoxy-L-arabinose transferase-like glycosyltransferase